METQLHAFETLTLDGSEPSGMPPSPVVILQLEPNPLPKGQEGRWPPDGCGVLEKRKASILAGTEFLFIPCSTRSLISDVIPQVSRFQTQSPTETKCCHL